MIGIGLILSVLTYGVLYVVAGAGFGWMGLDRPLFRHLLALCFLVAATVSVIRQCRDYWTQLKWDTTDPDGRMSNVYIPGRGGYLWNMNPLGPQSMRSFAKIAAALLVVGPDCIVQGVLGLMRTTRQRAGEDRTRQGSA
jgi:hypothetical protein